jgi:hypothetical protein
MTLLLLLSLVRVVTIRMTVHLRTGWLPGLLAGLLASDTILFFLTRRTDFFRCSHDN